VDDFLWCFDFILSVDTISWMTRKATGPVSRILLGYLPQEQMETEN